MQDQLIRQGINKESLDSGQQALLTVGKKIVDGRPLLPRVSSSSRSISSTSSLDSGPDTPPPWPPRGPTGPRGPRGPQDDHGLNGPVLGSSGGPAQVPISSGPSTAQTLPSQRLRNRGRFKSPTESKSQSVPQITLQHVSEPEDRSISPESTENGRPSLLSSHESLGLDKNNLVTSAHNSSNHGVRMKGAELPARSLMQRDPGDTSRAVQNLQVKEQDDQEELRKISEREKAFEISKQAEQYERKRKEEEYKREEELKKQRKLEEQKQVERERKEREQLRMERERQERIKREKREWQELIRKDQKQEKEADMVPIYK
ncbi:hypothetical protein BFJ71_g4116 [Fusarium oxysporum]|nr:hypothetical protein BFJ71_g4116 [Fusarium oxysporum]